MAAVREGLVEIVEAYSPMTVRQVFYQAVTRGLVDKTEGEYKSTICRLLGELRKDGELDYDAIADETRWMRKPDTYSDLASFMSRSKRLYRRALWDDQDAYVEIWLEKEALAGVLVDVTARWDVPLMVTRGYPSLSYLWSAANSLDFHADKECFLYYFGDHDPSGVDIQRSLTETLENMCEVAYFEIERVAVTPDQIEELSLPTRPTKQTDTRAGGWIGGSVEVDAIEPDQLRQLCEECIEQHVDEHELARTRQVEAAERQTLRDVVDGMEAQR